MKPLKKYNLAFTGLSIGKHNYNFDLDELFFDCFEKTEVTKADIKLDFVLDKSNSMLVLDFNMVGKVQLLCDRCSEYYWQELESSDRLFVKFGQAHYEQTDEIIVIADNETHLDISQYVYEFVHLNIPSRRIHPGGANKEDNCDPALLKRLEELSKETDESGHPKTGALDHWEVLKKLKSN